LKTNDARNLLLQLRDLNVPLTLSVPFLIRARGRGIQEVAAEAGCHRTLLRMALEGRRTPPPRLREALRQLIGTDPWETCGPPPPERGKAHD
jgi:hypothetical protein